MFKDRNKSIKIWNFIISSELEWVMEEYGSTHALVALVFIFNKTIVFMKS